MGITRSLQNTGQGYVGSNKQPLKYETYNIFS